MEWKHRFFRSIVAQDLSVAANTPCHGWFITLHTFMSLFPVTGLPNRIEITVYRTSREISTGLNKSTERALTLGFTALDIYRVAVGFLGKASVIIWRCIDFRRLFSRLAPGIKREHLTGRLWLRCRYRRNKICKYSYVYMWMQLLG